MNIIYRALQSYEKDMIAMASWHREQAKTFLEHAKNEEHGKSAMLARLCAAENAKRAAEYTEEAITANVLGDEWKDREI